DTLLARLAQRPEPLTANQARIGDDRTYLAQQRFQPVSATLAAVQATGDVFCFLSQAVGARQARSPPQDRFGRHARDACAQPMHDHDVVHGWILGLLEKLSVRRDQPNALELAWPTGELLGDGLGVADDQ